MAWKFFTKDGAEKRIPASVTNPQATIYHNTGQSLTSGVQTALSFNTVLADTASMTATANRLTATKAGRYLFEAAVEFAANATGIRQIYFRVNGSTVPAAEKLINSTAAETTQLTMAAAVDMAAGDYIEVVAAQTSGGALSVSAASAGNLFLCSLTGTKIDGAVVSYVGVPGSLVGQELAYAEWTGGNFTVSATTEATAQAVVTAPSVTFDGVMVAEIEFFAPNVNNNTSNVIQFALYDNGASIGQWAQFGGGTTGSGGWAARLSRRLTPSAGAHVFSARAYMNNASTGTVTGGVGGSGNWQPAFIKVRRAA